MLEEPNELNRAATARRRQRGRHAAALARHKLSPTDPLAAERLQEVTGALREAHGDYVAAADAGLAPIKATIDELGAGRLPLESEGAE